MECRACFGNRFSPFVDLGWQPPSNEFTYAGHIQYLLRMAVCNDCGLGQLTNDVPVEEIFNGSYAYFSSTSPSWLVDRKNLAARLTNELGLGTGSKVIDIGSNDGYFLKHFDKSIAVLGYEPAANVADAARAAGVPTTTKFWDRIGDSGNPLSDLINATNVLAHTPDMDGMIAGIAVSLSVNGTATLEFPLFSNLIKFNQLDTIYHEHYSYISINALSKVLDRRGLRIWRIEELATHGGSVRVFACRVEARFVEEESVARVRASELWAPDHNFESKAQKVKWDLLTFLASRRGTGPIVGYGAPAKATVLCNYAGLSSDTIEYTIDDSPAKQYKDIPGTNIEILPFSELDSTGVPKFILLFPWNLKEPIAAKLSKHYQALPPYERPTLVTAIPELTLTNI